MILDPWSTSLQYRASKFSSGDQVVPVVVKMTEFTKHKDTRWSSAPFYDNCNKEHKIQLKVTTTTITFETEPFISKYKALIDVPHNDGPKYQYLSVALDVDHMQPNQSANQFVVRLLNQKSDNQHCSVLMPLQCKNPIGASLKPLKPSVPQHYTSFRDLILLDKLHQITSTCQFLKDDSLFFEVLAKS